MNEFAKPNLAVDQFPPASVADSGKVLTVGEDGVPAWGQGGGGGGGGYKVTIALVTEKTGTSDKTSTEILNAAIGGSVPYAVLTIGGDVWGVLPLIAVMDGEASFGNIAVSSTEVQQLLFTVDSNGDATISDTVFNNGEE